MPYKILLNDGLDKGGIELLESRGATVDTAKRSEEELLSCIDDFDALIVRSATRVKRNVIERGKDRLKIIGRAGVGVDNIDINAATEFGIVVKNAPYGLSNATAELALGLMFALARNIPHAHQILKSGTWKKKAFMGTELFGKTLGIIGCGRIGQRLAMLGQVIGMRVIGYDPVINPNAPLEYVPKKQLLKESDFVSQHTGGKEVVIGGKELASMKSNAYLINTSRGANIDEEALKNALEKKWIAGAALDVHRDEPKSEGADFMNGINGLENLVLTPHLGPSTKEGQKKTAIEIATVVMDFLQYADYTNAINIGQEKEFDAPIYSLHVIHPDRPRVFAGISQVLGENEINILEIASCPFKDDGGAKAHTVFKTYTKVPQEIVEELRSKFPEFNFKL